MGNSGEPKGLDPHIVSGVLESNIIRSLFEGLVEAHPSNDGIAMPGVAEKWYPVDPTRPDEWIFELRKDAQWSDGEPLTAEDFLFSFRRLLTPALASDYSFMLYYIKDAEFYHKSQRSYLLFRKDANFTEDWWSTFKNVDFGPNEKAEENSFNFIGLDKLTLTNLENLLENPSLFLWPKKLSPEIRRSLIMKNLHFEKRNRGKLKKDELKDLWKLIELGATAPDMHTLRVKLNSPIPFLPEITKHYTWYPVPKHIVLKHGTIGERFTSWTKPENLVGNGAFVLKSWRFNDHIEVSRNRHYWDKSNAAAQKTFNEFNPANFVDKWDTPILIIQGGQDFRIPIGQGLEAFQAAQLKGIKSKLLYFPEENHWVLDGQNSFIWHTEFYKWLEETL